jgi:hypothetical protein
LSGYETKSPIPFSTNPNLRDVSPCNVSCPVCSVLDPPRFETSPVCTVESKLTMGTGTRDPPVIGKCFISKQERRSTRPDCKNVLKYVEANSKLICFERNSGRAGIILMHDLFVSSVRFLHTQRISVGIFIFFLQLHRAS